MTDYYTKDPARLQGKPKLTIGRYVASNGFLVPDMGEDINDRPDLDFARSESVQDYAGVSGYGSSFRIEHKFKDKVPTDKQILDKVVESAHFEKISCLLGIEIDRARARFGYSVWREILGDRLTLVADDAIEGRYHLSADMINPGWGIRHAMGGHVVIEDGRNVQSYGSSLTPKLREKLTELVGLYEGVRKLDHFDPNHCPIMELVHFEGEIYFVQYHRNRDMNTEGITLRQKDRRGMKTDFVRGATRERRELFKLTVVKYDEIVGKKVYDWSVPENEAAATCTDTAYGIYNDVYDEVMARERELQVLHHWSDVDDYLRMAADGHVKKSTLFKPGISLLVPEHSLCSKEELKHLKKRSLRTGRDQHIHVAVSSDGREAYVERVRYPRVHRATRFFT